MTKESATVLIVLAILGGTGCSVKFQPGIPEGVAQVGGIPLAAEAKAHDMPAVIGAGRFTVFAIKVADVTIKNGDGDRLVMDAIKATLVANGYSIVDAAQNGGQSLPILSGVVRRFSFSNYTWMFPIVPTWGGIDIDLRLEDRERRELWQKSYSESSWNLWMSFGSAVNSAMGKILDEFAKDIAGPDFQGAIETVAAR